MFFFWDYVHLSKIVEEISRNEKKKSTELNSGDLEIIVQEHSLNS